jgi:K+:H+ antiporter
MTTIPPRVSAIEPSFDSALRATPPLSRMALGYAIVVSVVTALILVTLRLGEAWLSPAGRAIGVASVGEHATIPTPLLEPVSLLILQLLVIMSTAQVLAAIARGLRQPAVVGEMAAGLLLGPSLFGRLWPGASAVVFPADSLGHLNLFSQFGVVLYMFTVGLDMRSAQLRYRAHTAVAVSHFSIVVPFCLGVLGALGLYRSYAPNHVDFVAFALFTGTAMSITAFPVLARVLDERGWSQTPLGTTALACAAVDDVSAWTLLAFVTAVVTAQGAMSALVSTLLIAVVFTLLMIYGVRPLMARILSDDGQQRPGRLSFVLGVAFASALVTKLAGIHALFGAFLAGAIVPGDRVRESLRWRLDTVSRVVLLPVFFAFTGLRTNLDLLNDAASWLACLAIITIAVAGKLVGSLAGARWSGSGWRDAFTLGVLMNTRGLMELVALNIGYDLGILSHAMFTMMVIMALVTTAMACPLIDLVQLLRKGGALAPDVQGLRRPEE